MLADHYSGLRVDAERGIVIGKRGLPIGTRNRDGYVQVGAFLEGRNRIFLAHRVVWEASHGVRLEAWQEVDHMNAERADNRLANLQAVTHAENAGRTRGAGTHRGMAANRHCKVSDEQVAEIKREVAAGTKKTVVGRRFGISSWHVTRLARGECRPGAVAA